jgi:eukaryotic-like serine/threonine-protein kinase
MDAARTERVRTALAGRYTVDREIGRGGMATVYLATDPRHGRRVAVKVLFPELARAIGPERFLQEIEIAARLAHPNILPLHDSGEADGLLYYVMPYVEGESLRARLDREGHLSLAESVEILTSVGRALSYAHAMGVIHRDIKPENILLVQGQAVVADFGIARAVDAAGSDRLTETGLAVGTPAYMSPEQASGARLLDGRSDVYSLGCLAYEMLGGDPPFTGPSPQAVMARHAIDPVPSLRTLRPTTPPGIERTIEKALAKVPADRFATAEAFPEARKWASTAEAIAADARRGTRPRLRRAAVAVGTAALLVAAGWWAVHARRGGKPERLAVLPPTSVTTGTDPGLLQGMLSSMIFDLSQAGVQVIGGAQSMMAYRNTGKTVREIAADLGVDLVLQPTVSWTGDSVGIGVLLLDGRSEASVWSHSYSAGQQDVLVLYRRVTLAIAERMRLSPPPGMASGLGSVRQVDAAAYVDYERGRLYAGNLTPADLQQAIDYFRQALAIDSDYAQAWAGLSIAWASRRQMGWPADSTTPIAVATARHALRLDSALAEAHHALGTALGWGDRNWTLAEQEFRRAIALNARYPDARASYSHLLLVQRRFAEANAQIDTALQMDPRNVKLRVFQAVVLLFSGHPDQALPVALGVERVVPNHPVAEAVLTEVYRIQGRYRECTTQLARAMAQDGIPRQLTDSMLALEASVGFPEAMRRTGTMLARRAEAGSPSPGLDWYVAQLYAYGGSADQAITWLEKDFAADDPNMPYIGVWPALDILRRDPRFLELLRRLNVPAPPDTAEAPTA